MLYAWSGYAEPPPGTNLGADPLGFRAVANRIARDLVPGLTQATRATRGFSLLALGLQIARNQNERHADDAYLRFERLWVLAQVAQGRRGSPFPGVVRAKALLTKTPLDEGVPLDRRLLADELGGGGWGAYRKAATAFGLLEPARGSRRATGVSHPSGTRPSVQGTRLAATVRSQPGLSHVPLARFVTDGTISRASLERVGEANADPSDEEVAILSTQIADFDDVHDGALGRLASVYEAEERLTLAALHRQRLALNSDQRRALAAARSLIRLMSQIERPYRAWVSGGSPVALGELRTEDWHAVAPFDSDGYLAALRSALSRPRKTSPAAALKAVHRHQADVAALRGAEAWDRGDPRLERARFRRPDFTLDTTAALFSEGVDPRGR